MGSAIDQEIFDEADYVGFQRRLTQCLATLGRLLERPGFGVGPASLGAELELFLVDDDARPLLRNQAVRAATADPRVSLELDRFNLELNATPTPLAGPRSRRWGRNCGCCWTWSPTLLGGTRAGWGSSASCPRWAVATSTPGS
jgi:hypothetical protein